MYIKRKNEKIKAILPTNGSGSGKDLAFTLPVMSWGSPCQDQSYTVIWAVQWSCCRTDPGLSKTSCALFLLETSLARFPALSYYKWNKGEEVLQHMSGSEPELEPKRGKALQLTCNERCSKLGSFLHNSGLNDVIPLWASVRLVNSVNPAISGGISEILV